MEFKMEWVVTVGLSIITSLATGFFWLGRYKEKVDKLSNLPDRINTHDRKITVLDEFKNNATKSPLSLTELGLKVLEESGGKQYIDENKHALIKIINDKNPRTSLDIQELSKEVIESQKNEENFIPIKEYVYNKGLIFDHVIRVIAIYLRDMALDGWNYKSKTK